jgi:hypothetical protein
MEHTYDFPKEDLEKVNEWVESVDLDAEAEKAKKKPD